MWCAWEAQQAAVLRLAEEGLQAAVKLGSLNLEDTNGCLALAARMLPPSRVSAAVSGAV